VVAPVRSVRTSASATASGKVTTRELSAVSEPSFPALARQRARSRGRQCGSRAQTRVIPLPPVRRERPHRTPVIQTQHAQGRKAHAALGPVRRNIDRLEITVRNGNIRTSHTCILARSDETDNLFGQLPENWADHLRPDRRCRCRCSIYGR
jgi:hypothetical protein